MYWIIFMSYVYIIKLKETLWKQEVRQTKSSKEVSKVNVI